MVALSSFALLRNEDTTQARDASRGVRHRSGGGSTMHEYYGRSWIRFDSLTCPTKTNKQTTRLRSMSRCDLAFVTCHRECKCTDIILRIIQVTRTDCFWLFWNRTTLQTVYPTARIRFFVESKRKKLWQCDADESINWNKKSRLSSDNSVLVIKVFQKIWR